MSSFARKWLAYHVKEYTDPLAIRHLKEVSDVWEQHSAELEDFWRLTSPDECASHMVAFLDELRREWPREFKELNPERLPDAVRRGLTDSIKQAFLVGCMVGEGWISQEQETDFGIYLGDELARDIRSVLKGAKSRGIAFASGFTAVTVRGYLKVLQKASEGTMAALASEKPTEVEDEAVEAEVEQEVLKLRQQKDRFCPQCGARCLEGDRFCSRCGTRLRKRESVVAEGTLSALNTDKPTYEPSKYEILNEILLTEGKNLMSKHFKHPELLGRSTYISVDPFNRSDYDYLVSAFLAGRIGHFNTEKLEGIFKKLLQDDYDEYYEAAKQRIIASH